MAKFSLLPTELYYILFDYLTDVDLFLFSLMNRKFKSANYKIRRITKIDADFIHKVIKYGYLRLFVHLYSIGHRLPDNCFITAIQYNRLNILKYLHKNKKYLSSHAHSVYYLCSIAALYGSLKCLKYLHSAEDTWDESVIFETYSGLGGAPNHKSSTEKWIEIYVQPSQLYMCAAAGNSLPCFKYLHRSGCPWSEETCEMAAYEGKLEYLKYAVLNNCPWDKDKCINTATGMRRQDVVDWINSLP
jgi:hypothetical protein